MRGRFKLIRFVAPARGHRLFDLAADPLERHDTRLAHPDATRRLGRLLTRHAAATPAAAPAPPPLTPEIQARLRQLGYAP